MFQAIRTAPSPPMKSNERTVSAIRLGPDRFPATGYRIRPPAGGLDADHLSVLLLLLLGYVAFGMVFHTLLAHSTVESSESEPASPPDFHGLTPRRNL